MATTITALKTYTSTTARPFHRPTVWLTALVLSAALGAVTIWLLVATSGDHAKTAKSPVTNVQTVRGSYQPGAMCAPAPGTRYC